MGDLSPGGLAFLLLSGLLAGGVNAIAGGGSLLVFPALLAVGFSPLEANVTNSVAQWPGYLGVVGGVRDELAGQGRRILLTSIVAVIGAVVGCLLLLALPDRVFDAVVPALVLLAGVLMACQPRIRTAVAWAHARTSQTPDADPDATTAPAPDRTRPLLVVVFLGAIYGGYFGGALGVILIAALSLLTNDRLIRLNALKALLALVIATVTVLIFAVGAPVDWIAAAAVAPTTLIGGYLGARVARRLREDVLRWAVVLIAFAVGIYLVVS